MTDRLPEPSRTIAPPEAACTTGHYLGDMLEGAYADGAVLEYDGLLLVCKHYDQQAPVVWDVHNAEETYIETLNLGGFRSATALQQLLDEMVATDPATREEWVYR